MKVHVPIIGVVRLSLVIASKTVGVQIQNEGQVLLKIASDMLEYGCVPLLSLDNSRGHCVAYSKAIFDQIRRSPRLRSKIYLFGLSLWSISLVEAYPL